MRSARSNMTGTWLLGNARIAMESGATSLPWRPSGGCGANGRRQKPRGRRQRLSGRQRRQRLRGRRRRQPPAPFGPALAGTPARARLRPRRHSAARLARRRRALWMCLKAGTSVYFQTPLGGVQCSFEHKLPRRRGSRGQRESTEPEIGVAGREQARPRFPAFLAGSGRSSPNQRSSRQGMLAWNFRRRLWPHRPSSISPGAAPSVVARAKP